MQRLILVISCAAAIAAAPSRAVQAGWIYNEGEAPVRAAIIEALQTRMGSTVDGTIGTLQVRAAAGATITAPVAAVPDVGARTGGFIRFVLYQGRPGGTKTAPRRMGTADAEIFVTTETAQARRAIARGQIITAEDIDTARADVGRVPLKPVPGARSAIGAKALRAIQAGERIAATMIAAPPLVKSGDPVQTIVRRGSLEARGMASATQSGTLGEEIRLVNTNSRRSLRGRVVGAREVEVMHEH